jgi:hypothetical protein
MITEQLINNADEKVRSLCVENKKMRALVYVPIGISSFFGLALIYFIYETLSKKHLKKN